MPVPDDVFAKWVDVDELKALLPPGYSIWWMRGKVLHTEIIERPIYRTNIYPPGQAFGPIESPTGEYLPDTHITVQDIDANPPKGYEIRLRGRRTDYQVGDAIELFGHRASEERRHFPRAAGSLETEQWEYAYAPTLADGSVCRPSGCRSRQKGQEKASMVDVVGGDFMWYDKYTNCSDDWHSFRNFVFLYGEKKQRQVCHRNPSVQ